MFGDGEMMEGSVWGWGGMEGNVWDGKVMEGSVWGWEGDGGWRLGMGR